jgi:hypothetical protein
VGCDEVWRHCLCGTCFQMKTCFPWAGGDAQFSTVCSTYQGPSTGWALIGVWWEKGPGIWAFYKTLGILKITLLIYNPFDSKNISRRNLFLKVIILKILSRGKKIFLLPKILNLNIFNIVFYSNYLHYLEKCIFSSKCWTTFLSFIWVQSLQGLLTFSCAPFSFHSSQIKRR